MTTTTPRGSDAPPAELSSVLRANIQALAQLRRASEQRRDRPTRVADAVTRFAGSVHSVVLHALLFGGWILVNSGVIPVIQPFDPFPFVMLAMWASVEAIFLTTFVLISQNRMAALSSRRDELDVQISLLAEHEITRVIQMLDALLRHLQVPVPAREIDALKKDVDPLKVVREIEDIEQQVGGR